MRSKRLIFSFGLISLIIIVFVLGITTLNYRLFPMHYVQEVKEVGNAYGFDKALILSVINTESSFNAGAISPKGAIGLMQLMPTTAKWICEVNNIPYNQDNLINPNYNITLGVLYLKYLSKKFVTTNEVLCAYNAGEGNVSLWLKNQEYSSNNKTLNNIPYKETKNYVQKVNRAYSIYKHRI